jgi:hypothetical protein
MPIAATIVGVFGNVISLKSKLFGYFQKVEDEIKEAMEGVNELLAGLGVDVDTVRSHLSFTGDLCSSVGSLWIVWSGEMYLLPSFPSFWN